MRRLANSGFIYRSLFNNTLDGLAYCKMIFDAKGAPLDFSYVEVNKEFEALTGLKNVVGKKVTELIPGIKESNPELFEIYGRVSMTGKPERFETYLKPLSRWFLVSVYSPKKKFFVAVFQDSTTIKQTAIDLKDARIAARNVLEDLQVEKDRLGEVSARDEAVLASIADGCIAVDKNGSIILLNRVAQKLLGFSSTESLGRPWHEILRAKDNDDNPLSPEKGAIRAALSNGTTTTTPVATYSFYYLRKDGTKFPASRTVSPIMLNKKIIGAVDIFRDISREKEIDQAKSEFVSLASHQLRTPPSIIGWYTEMLKSGDLGPVNPKQADYLDEIYRANKRMLGTVSSLLNISRIEMGTFSITPKDVKLENIIDETIKELTLRFDRTIEIKKTYAPDLGSFKADPDIIAIIIDNILSNSFKYSPGADAKIEITATRKGDSLLLSIKDNGIGIPADDQNQVFGKMFRGVNAVSSHPDGTGLGLYMAQKLVDEGLGGKIWFDSKENEGTTFHVSIPVSGVKEKTGTTKLVWTAQQS